MISIPTSLASDPKETGRCEWHAQAAIIAHLNLIEELVSGGECLGELCPACFGRRWQANRGNPVHLSGHSCLDVLCYPD